MFYCSELLTVRRKGRLARCWLAATLTEKMFKKTVPRTTLETIKISALCEEILRTVQRCSNTDIRFSLYLSSQLMYGATKILFYQTKQLQDYLFAATRQLYNVKISPKADFDLPLVLREPEIPGTEMFDVRNAAPDLNLIIEDPSVFGHMVQDELNFGALTNDEMERFLLPQAEEQFLNEVRRFCWDQQQEIIEGTIQVPPIDMNNIDIEALKKKETQQMDLADRREVLIDIGGIPFKKPVTPRKRTTKSPPETPTKKRKISSEEIRKARSPCAEMPSAVFVGPVVPESVVEPAEVSVQGPILIECPNQPVRIIEQEELVLETRRGGIKFVDKKTILSDVEMHRWITNVAAHTKERGLYNTHFHSAEYYFKQPCSMISHGVLGKKLVKQFSRHMTTRSVTDNEFTDIVTDLSLPVLHHDETMRAEETSNIPERTVDIPSQIEICDADTVIISEHLKTAEEKLSIEDIQWKLPEEQIETPRKKIDETLAPLPEIIDFDEKIGPKVTTTKIELDALLRVHWRDGTFAQFHKIIPPDTYTKLDAAHAFRCFLEFHTERHVVLKQAEPFDTIWIEKPMESSEESNGGTPERLQISS